ncbi:kinase-like domain-containing protein [Mycena vitilis]|nr:kinase-like domain-containing protein [Mycena vitilis]
MSKWSASFQALGLIASSNSQASNLLLDPPSAQLDRNLIKRFKETVEGIAIQTPTLNSIPPFRGHLANLRPLIGSLDQVTVWNNSNTPETDAEPSDEENKFAAVVYAFVLGACCKNRWVGKYPDRMGFKLPSDWYPQARLIIGRGSVGTVYLMPYNGGILAEKRCLSISKVDRLKPQIFILQKLINPHIVRFLDATYQQPNLHVIMEYVPGGTVEGMTEALGPITEEEALPICRQLIDGLRYLHSQQPPIVHRNIKSANLLLTWDGCVKIADLGLAAPNPLRAHNWVWMAPEMIHSGSGECGTGVDVWSTACVLADLLEGGHPWRREDDRGSPYDLMAKIIKFEMHVPAAVSKHVQELFDGIFVESDRRLSIRAVGEQPWFRLASDSQT